MSSCENPETLTHDLRYNDNMFTLVERGILNQGPHKMDLYARNWPSYSNHFIVFLLCCQVHFLQCPSYCTDLSELWLP